MGEAMARRFAALGANVAIIDRDKARGEKLAHALGGQTLFLPTDVCEGQSIVAAVEKTVAQFGEINIVCCSAGIDAIGKMYSRKQGPFPTDTYKRMIDVNVSGVYFTVQAAVSKMIHNKPTEIGERGVIILLASIAGHEGQAGQVAYAATKGAVLGMVLPMARELGSDGIRAVSISPGLIETPMFHSHGPEIMNELVKGIPFPKKAGDPADFAALTEFIVRTPTINGLDIRLDGALRN